MNEIKFVLRHNVSADPLIRMVYRHGGNKFVYGTGINIAEIYWDTNKNRISPKFPKHGLYNSMLNKIEEALVKAVEHFNHIDVKPSNAQLKFKLEGALLLQKQKRLDNAVEVGPYIDKYIQRIKSEETLAEGTLQGFDQLKSKWGNFVNGYGVSFEDLDLKILKSFHSHMLSCGYSQSQREKIQRKLVTILTYAEKADKICVNTDYKLRFWKVGVPSTVVRVVLSDSEIKLVRDFDFPGGSLMDKVRDRWIIGFATGQRYSDFKGINKDNIREIRGKRFIEIIQQKTGKIVNIPLFKDVELIFDKYDGYPPTFSDQKFNKQIKEVAKSVGINQIVTKILQITPNDRRITTHPKYETVSSHICRRSFATNGSLKGISIRYLMEITGHKNIQTFLNYIHFSIDDLPENLPSGDSIFN